jgi:hypothetical protein
VRLRLPLVEMVLLVLAVAAAAPVAGQTQPVTARPSLEESTCLITPPVQATPANNPNADPFGSGPWYINVDRSMWAVAGQWVEGRKGNKVLWIRPQGTNLAVSARRLDGDDGRPFRADIPCCYPTGFQASKIYFPTSGCWEITATAGRSALRFVTRV